MLSARSQFSQRTFAAMQGNRRDAPEPAVHQVLRKAVLPMLLSAGRWQFGTPHPP